MLTSFYEYIFHLFQSVDYGGIFIMMLIESSLIPFPSEVPMLAIGIQAAKGTMNPFFGLIVSLVAIFIGATMNYAIGYFIGDAFFEKYGKYFLIKKHAYHEAKKLFAEDETFYTFYGRLMPLIRQLISLPAGIVRMRFWKFMWLTLAGSAVWHSILITVGYFIGENAALAKWYLTTLTLIFFIAGVLFLLYKHRKLVVKLLKYLKKS
jgi:membrane protein DedA with SNARE-associated domain